MTYVYMLTCSDGTLYTGWTTDLAERLAAHQAGRGARYTRTRLPVKLVYRETCPNRSSAMKRESAIKKLTRTEKLALVEKYRHSLDDRF